MRKWQRGVKPNEESQIYIAEALDWPASIVRADDWPNWLPLTANGVIPFGPHSSVPALREALLTAMERRSAVAVEGIDAVIGLTAADLGGWAGTNIPGLPAVWSGALAGVLGLALAFGVMELFDSFLSSLRALTRTTPPAATSTYSAKDMSEALPNNPTPQELAERLAEAARADVAHEAAGQSWRIDHARTLLNNPKRWVGFEDNTALFPIIDSAYVRYTTDNGTPVYEFVAPVTGGEPIPLKTMAQLLELTQQYLKDESEEPLVV